MEINLLCNGVELIIHHKEQIKLIENAMKKLILFNKKGESLYKIRLIDCDRAVLDAVKGKKVKVVTFQRLIDGYEIIKTEKDNALFR